MGLFTTGFEMDMESWRETELSLLQEYHCPKCGIKPMGLSPYNDRFYCSVCNIKWVIMKKSM